MVNSDNQADERAAGSSSRAISRAHACGSVAIWARHPPALTWCRVIAVDDHRAMTACHGSWPVADDIEITDAPVPAERCDACVTNTARAARAFDDEWCDLGGEG